VCVSGGSWVGDASVRAWRWKLGARRWALLGDSSRLPLGSVPPAAEAGNPVRRTALHLSAPFPRGPGVDARLGRGGSDACDWPGQHLGRPAPPPPSCWEQLLLSQRSAVLGRPVGLWSWRWGSVGEGWRRPCSRRCLLLPVKVLETRARVPGQGTQRAETAPEKGDGGGIAGASLLSKADHSSLLRQASVTEPRTWGVPRGLEAVCREASLLPDTWN
jgi:hypothetical protein